MSADAVRTVRIPRPPRPPGCRPDPFLRVEYVRLRWVCPRCGAPRGEPYGVASGHDRSVFVHVWQNPCGHLDTYAAVRAEGALERFRAEAEAELAEFREAFPAGQTSTEGVVTFAPLLMRDLAERLEAAALAVRLLAEAESVGAARAAMRAHALPYVRELGRTL